MSTVADKRNIKDHKRRLLAAKYEVKQKLYKALHRDVDLPNELREKFHLAAPVLSIRSFVSCIVFRTLANQGMLMGIKKASW
ncbi:hypothetical protein EZV62_014529 [Acer yangbiense]|uniref:Small ribosomal subunit protein uS14m n=1 Tax=Acer yangbiense TaxID=1000413 RepID=A0A5C7HUL3_9ROSI|nr:hypothetical protein EZV62_014529 [Acer yangbiense]